MASQLDTSTPDKGYRQRLSYRDAVTNLNTLELKLAQLLKQIILEVQQPMARMVELEHGRESAERRAQYLDRIVMAFVTVAIVALMCFLQRSDRVPRWSKEISSIATEAVLAGWFPL